MIIEIHTKHENGEHQVREYGEGEKLRLYGDETEIRAYVKEKPQGGKTNGRNGGAKR